MTSPVQTVDTALRYVRPILFGCAAAAMIGLAGCGLVGHVFWSMVLD